MDKYKNYQTVITDDGSTTLYSKLYGESCHSNSGAEEETRVHYIQGCNVIEQAKFLNSQSKKIRILEVGFGTGIGFNETLKALKYLSLPFKFTSFEIDYELIQIYSKENQIIFKCLELTNGVKLYSHREKNYELQIFLGNARNSIKELQNRSTTYNAIFQDAFSPKRNAILWTTEWFRDLKHIADLTCIMSTYSASSSIRKSMIAAGWSLKNGKNFGAKKSSTRATLTEPTEEAITEKLNRSPAIELKDENYLTYTIGNTHEKNKDL